MENSIIGEKSGTGGTFREPTPLSFRSILRNTTIGQF